MKRAMHLVITFTLVCWGTSLCDLVPNGCNELSCLFSEMALIRSLVEEHGQALLRLQQVTNKLMDGIDPQRQLTAASPDIVSGALLQEESSVQQLQHEIAALPQQNQTEGFVDEDTAGLKVSGTIIPSIKLRQAGDPALESVVNQMGHQIEIMLADIQALKNKDQTFEDKITILQLTDTVFHNNVSALERVFDDSIAMLQNADMMFRDNISTFERVLGNDIAMLQNTDMMLRSNISTLQHGIENGQTVDRLQDQTIQDGRTSTFVRWGSSSCPGSSSLIYSGVVGGAPLYSYAGGGSNYLCLTMSPVHGYQSTSYQAYMYGTQYEDDRNALCAVCRANLATTIMVPGTYNCPSGWTEQYYGYLMAQYYHYYASEFICVDYRKEGRSVSSNSAGSYLYYTLTECGTLPCGPYIDNTAMRCVVCSL